MQGKSLQRKALESVEETTSKKLLGHRLLVLGLNGFPVQKLWEMASVSDLGGVKLIPLRAQAKGPAGPHFDFRLEGTEQ